jgi:uncharacterized protein (DUF1330 family)
MLSSNGSVDPTRSQFEAFKRLVRDEPIHMLNLIRLRETAAYPPGHLGAGRIISGMDAYRSYGRYTAAIFERVGGRQIWLGEPEAVVIGPADEYWDLAFIAEYPTAHAFLQMITSTEYREHVIHRQAAVADSRLIRLKPLNPGAQFGACLD